MNLIEEYFPESLKTRVINIYPTGSRYICDPPVMDTDIDFVVFVFDIQKFQKVAVKRGFELPKAMSREEDYDKDPLSLPLRKGKINLIVTDNIDFYNSFVLATKVAKQLNLLKRKDRLMVFKAIRNREFVYD